MAARLLGRYQAMPAATMTAAATITISSEAAIPVIGGNAEPLLDPIHLVGSDASPCQLRR
jgi:hypothetical protein